MGKVPSVANATVAVALVSLVLNACAASVPDTRLDGIWLADAADRGDGVSWLSAVWSSRVTLAGDRFTISNFRGLGKDLTGSFALDATGNGTIDLKVNEFVLSETRSLKYPACGLPGMYQLAGDHLSVCFSVGQDPRRPENLNPNGWKQIVLKLVRADGFQGFPTEVTVKIQDPRGKVVAGVEVCGSVSHYDRRDGEKGWRYDHKWGRTGVDGSLKVPYGDLAQNQIVAHDADRKLWAIATESPTLLRDGVVTIRLASERLVLGTLTCGVTDGGNKVPTWSNVFVMQSGRRIGNFASTSGRFSFALPPGNYTLDAYGTQLTHKLVPFTVPPGEGEIRMPAIALSPVEFFDAAGVRREAVKRGVAAPELESVTAWRGKPVKLSELRGKVVLLNFWGYWCGPCVSEMPALIELNEWSKNKGLVIVSVHVDVSGEIDTVSKFDTAIAKDRQAYWAGKDLPFPVALVSGKLNSTNHGPARQFGVFGFPTTVIIDRQGKVVGEFGAFGPKDGDKAVAAAEKLLRQGD
jgi:uncharacterized protein (TIGR03067 family)